MAVDGLTPVEALALIPQQPPFRFVDEIRELDDEHVVSSYRYRENEFFYAGHFPGNAITPGVILVETIAQGTLLPLGLHLLSHEMPPERLRHMTTVFTDAEAEFHALVRPGETVVMSARPVFFRRGKLRVEAALTRADGTLACSGRFAAMGVESL